MSGSDKSVVTHGLNARRWRLVSYGANIAMLYLASGAVMLCSGSAPAPSWRLAVLFPLLVIGLMAVRRAPEAQMRLSAVDAVMQVFSVVSLAGMLLIALETIGGDSRPVATVLPLWLLAVPCLAATRAALVSVERRARRNGMLATPTLIIGAGNIGEDLVRRLLERPDCGLRPIGLLDADPRSATDSGTVRGVPVLGAPEDLERVATLTGAQQVIVAFSSDRDQTHLDVVRRCQTLGLEVSIVPRLFEAISDRVTLEHVGGLPLLALRTVDPRGWQFALKHAVDRVVAALMLLAVAPLMLVIALGVRLSSPGPALFRQRGVGRDGQEFDLYKFRSMTAGGDRGRMILGDGLAPGGVEGSDRRTPIGYWLRATSLDELPQLLNVLRGEMSLIGPRPERPEFVERFAREVNRYNDRHRVKSGITGWAQVNGLRGQTSIADRAEHDNHYIQNWSFRFDLRILALTIAEVARLRDAGPRDRTCTRASRSFGVRRAATRSTPATPRIHRA